MTSKVTCSWTQVDWELHPFFFEHKIQPNHRMNRTLSFVLLAVGIILVIYGINASQSVSSEVSQAVTGTPTDRSMWLLIGGAVLAIVGLFGVVRGGRRRLE